MKILFITHNSALAGAPLVLLHFLQWIKNHHPEVEIHLLDMVPGAMADGFKRCCHSYKVMPNIATKKNLTTKVLEKTGILEKTDEREELIDQLVQLNFDIIYANTVKSVSLGTAIKVRSPKTKLIAHIHEMHTVIKLLFPKFIENIVTIDAFVAVSKMVKTNLTENYKISKSKIFTVYPFAILNKTKNFQSQQMSFQVGASGFVDWRKGYDIFIQVARYLDKHHPMAEIIFTWVGTVPHDTEIIIRADLEKLGLLNKVSFIGEQENPWPFYNAFDIFMLPSREDPFPLVCIEMAMLKKPILCFEGVAGTAEILENGGGRIIPYLDIETMAETILEYFNNRPLLEEDGEKVAQLFSEFTPENQCPKLFSVIEDVLNNSET